MKHIKIFEEFELIDQDYIKNSIKDILVELNDIGMVVTVDFSLSDSKEKKEPGITIEISGQDVNGYPYQMHKEFNTLVIKDYIDMVIDFIREVWPNFDLHFDLFDVDDSHITGGKDLNSGRLWCSPGLGRVGKCGSMVLQIYKGEV